MKLIRARRSGSPLSAPSLAPLAAGILLPLLATGVVAQRVADPASVGEVRELGRLEQPELTAVIRPFLSDTAPAVRAEAANALAHALWPLLRDERRTGDHAIVAQVAGALRSRLEVEREPVVVASIAQSLGRLPYGGVAEVRGAEHALASLLTGGHDAEIATGAARGLESLVRIAGSDYSPSSTTLSSLRSLARGDTAGAGPALREATPFALPRRLALMTLIAAQVADSTTLRVASRDADPQLRRLAAMAAMAAGSQREVTTARDVLRALVLDRAPMVRTEALRALSRLPGAECAPFLRAASDPAPHVSITAIDEVGRRCIGTSSSEAAGTLVDLVRAGAGGAVTAGSSRTFARLPMHRAAHALVSLARVAPGRAWELIGPSVASPAWQARVYAARAAAVLADTNTLEALARDSDPNVRTEAVAALAQLLGHAADSIYISELAARDYQLVLTAARALRGTPHPAPATRALLAALTRITAEKRETSRDPRLAILQSIAELGSADMAGAVMRYREDFDSVLADSAAALVSRWTGRAQRAAPIPLPEVDRPIDDPRSLRDLRVRFTMARSDGGGRFELQLFPDEAPATISRFLRLARSGYYDGLTVHRVVPNFVIQGGSPGANEYMGDGPFMRDEVGLRSHERGSVSISTRGRGTGDAQFFINLVDNPRLDHEYTVFAQVVAGMPVVDQLLEGDVIDRVEIISGR